MTGSTRPRSVFPRSDSAPGYADGPSAPASLVTVRFIVMALRRQLSVVAFAGIGGLLVAMSFFVLSPPESSATTAMLLTHAGQGDATSAMQNDVQLLRTRTVANRAIRKLGLRMSARELLSSYRVDAVSQEILVVRMSGPSPGVAVRRASAVADEFLAFRGEELERQARAIVEVYEARSNEIVGEISELNRNIETLSADGTRDAGVRGLGELLSRRAVLTDQLAQLRRQVQSAFLEPTVISRTSRVIDPATADEKAVLKMALSNSIAGGLGGAVLAAFGIVTLAIIGADRLRLPEDVASAAGVPVVLGVHDRRKPIAGFLRRRRGEGSDARMVSQYLEKATKEPDGGAGRLIVASVDADRSAASAVAAAASDLAGVGMDVFVADFSGRSHLSKIFSLHPARTPQILDSEHSGVLRVWVPINGRQVFGDEREDGLSDGLDSAEAVLTLISLDPAVGAMHLREWSRSAIVFIRAGQLTAQDVRSACRLIRDAGIEVVAIVVSGADRGSKCLGVAPAYSSTAQEKL